MKIKIKATPEMMKLAQEALDIQNACNLCGLAQRFGEVMKVLHNSEQDTGTNWANQHPITRAWIDKFEHLARMEQGLEILGYDKVIDLSRGVDIEHEIAA